MAAAIILDFQIMWIWPFSCVDSVIFELCTKFGSNCYSHWDQLWVHGAFCDDALHKFTFSSTHLRFKRSFDDVTRINFRFRLLVRWSSPHARDASSHKIWCIYLYPIRSYWHFSKLKMAVAAILDLLGGRGPCKILPEIKSIHQSATFITNPDWKKLRLWSLEDRCVRADLIKVYKIVNGLSSVKFDVVFSSKVWYLFRIFIL